MALLLSILMLRSIYALAVVLPVEAGRDTLIDLVKWAQPCDTLILSGTFYTEKITLDKPLTIMGNHAHIVSKNGDEIFHIKANDVEINGLKLSGVSTNYLKENAALHFEKAHHFTVKNNVIDHCFFAIYLAHCKGGIIENNQIEGDAREEITAGNGIHVWYCRELSITNNRVKKQRDGIYFEFVSHSTIVANHCENNNRYGLHFMFSNDDQYHNNTFINNGVGVAVMFSKNIEMTENIFAKNWGKSSYGLLLKEINDANILQNTFYVNTLGIFVEGSNRVNYSCNDFIKNGWAIKFSGGCSANVITRNNFLHNTLDLQLNTKLNDNKIEYNYWTEYNGYDLNGDGIGDLAHHPIKLFSHILHQVSESIILLNSFFVDLVNFIERVSPVFTPVEVEDAHPLISKVSC